MVEAGDLVSEVWDNNKSDMSPDQAALLAGAAVEHYKRGGIETQGEEFVTEIANYVDQHPKSTSEDKAFAYNQVSKLISAYNPAGAKEYELKAIQLDPSYRYNLSITHETWGQIDEAIEAAEAALARQGEDKDGDFYSQAIDVYLKRLEGLDSSDDISISETEERLRQLLQELSQVDQNLWRVQLASEKRLRSLASD